MRSCVYGITFFSFVLIAASISSGGKAKADGMLDFADPCKGAQKEFGSTAEALKTRADAVISEWDARQEPPGEIRGLYVEAIRKAAFQAWSTNDQVKPLIATLKQSDPKFDEAAYFYEKVYPAALTNEQESEMVRALFKADYQSSLRPKFLEDRKSLDKKIDEQKQELDSSCKPDVFNQVIRATFGRAILIVTGNFDAAKNESGEIAKLVRATSGISLTDIEKYGIQGGPNSEISKALRAVGVGPNSEITKGLKVLTDTLNPTKWKLDLPNNPPPVVNIPIGGGVRICVPWC